MFDAKKDAISKSPVTHVGFNLIKYDVHIDNQGELVIGPNSCINYGVWIEMHTHDFNRDDWPSNDNPHILVIGGHVHIGIRAIILGGCKRIAEGVLIGAGSVVTKDILEPWTIWAGNPVKKIGDRKRVNTDLREAIK
jgi:acetyltransferase-like isoleucine patch superfamily enzyme